MILVVKTFMKTNIEMEQFLYAITHLFTKTFPITNSVDAKGADC
jgi:hypothetical protein